MKSKASLEREWNSVVDQINKGMDDTDIGDPGSVKYEVAFAIYHTLMWAMGRRVEYPTIRLNKLYPNERKYTKAPFTL
jgi:hypothetical protein